MKKLIAALAVLALAACASAALTEDQSYARSADREMILATAALNIAYITMQTPGLSPAVVADIKAAAQAVTAGVSDQIASLQAGGSATSQIIAGLSGAVGSALPNLGTILSAAHGSSATPQEVAMAAGEASFQNVPQIAALIANDLDPNWFPQPSQLTSDANALAAAAAKFSGS